MKTELFRTGGAIGFGPQNEVSMATFRDRNPEKMKENFRL